MYFTHTENSGGRNGEGICNRDGLTAHQGQHVTDGRERTFHRGHCGWRRSWEESRGGEARGSASTQATLRDLGLSSALNRKSSESPKWRSDLTSLEDQRLHENRGAVDLVTSTVQKGTGKYQDATKMLWCDQGWKRNSDSVLMNGTHTLPEIILALFSGSPLSLSLENVSQGEVRLSPHREALLIPSLEVLCKQLWFRYELKDSKFNQPCS